MPAAYEWTDAEREDICQSYSSGEPSTSIAKRYDVSGPTIRSYLKRWGIRIRTMRENCALGQFSKYSHDDSFFHCIDTEEKAYWLGFINADGCVTGDRLTIQIQARDRVLLQQFRHDLHANHSIRQYNGMVEITISSINMVSDLKRHGIAERKAKEGREVGYPSSLASHYWRGVVDGDGHIQPTTRQRMLCLAGNRPTIESFSSWVKNLNPEYEAGNPYKTERTWRVDVCGGIATQIVTLLYRGSSRHLKRKFHRAAAYWRPA